MGLPLLASLRLRGARVEPLPDRGGVEAELTEPDLRERDLTVVHQLVNTERSHVQKVGDLFDGPQGGHRVSWDRTPRCDQVTTAASFGVWDFRAGVMCSAIGL